MLSAGLDGIPAELRGSEWAGEYVYQLGRACVQAGERDRADALATELHTLKEATGSKLLASRIAALR